jgi:hypothetical protein
MRYPRSEIAGTISSSNPVSKREERAPLRVFGVENIVRVVPIALLIALAGTALAQISREEKPIQDAFANLRLESEVYFGLDGTDSLGTRTNVLNSNAFFKWEPTAPDKYAKSEINDWVNSGHTHRIVADGITVWSYDFGHNTYTSFRYGLHAGAPPKNFRTDMLQEMTTASQSQTTFLARILREVYSGDFAQYRTWLPMANVTTVAKGSPPMPDPVITTRTYTGDDLNYYIVYTYSTRPQRSSAFHFTRKDMAAPWDLSDIYYADRTTMRTGTRTVDWKVSIYRGTLPTSTNYLFQPPSNARPIANVRTTGG